MTPVYSVLPVLFIMTVTGIKDAYENYRKERSDDEVNSQLTEVVNNQGAIESEKWKHLRKDAHFE